MDHLIAKPSEEMSWGTGRKSKAAAKISLLLSGDDGMVQTALIAPLLASIAATYPGATALQLDHVMSITALTMIISMVFASRLAYHFNKKHIIIVGTLIFACAGVAGELTTSLAQLTFTRALIGIGAGIAFPQVPSIIAYLFQEEEKNQMLGWMNAVGAFMSLTLSAIAGVIALTNWKHAFLFYLMFLLVSVIQWFCLPEFKPEKEENAEREEELRANGQDSGIAERVGWKPWIVGLCMLAFMILAMVSTFKISLFIEGNGIGTSANSGLCTSIMTGCSFAISLFFASFLKLFKKYSCVVSLAFMTLSFATLCFADNFSMCMIGMGLLGLAMGTMNPFFFSTMSHVAPTTRSTFCMSMMCIFQLAGQIFTPYYMAGVAALGFASERQLFGFTACLVGIITVFILVLVMKSKAMSRDLPSD